MSVPESRLTEIFDVFQSKILQIDDLERRIDHRAVRARRRIMNLLDHTKPYRNSHVRLFCTHQHATPAPVVQNPEGPPKPRQPNVWTLNIEGKLLIGHLDHAAAVAFDAKTNYTPPTDDLDRSRQDKEEEEVPAIQFTHFFDTVGVQFYTVFQPKQKPITPKKKTPTKKSSRRGSTAKSPAAVVEEREVDPRLLTASPKTELLWTKTMMTEDSHGFAFQYPEAQPTAPGRVVHSVVATVQLYPVSAGTDPIYQASAALANALFPSHGPDPADKNRKRGADEMDTSPMEEPIPFENEVEIPQGLTMKEITNAVFTYVHDRKLSDETERSIVVCDKVLAKLFETNRFSFSQLQEMLFAQNLVRKISNDPIRLTYVMKENTACPNPSDPVKDPLTENENHPALLQMDTDVAVPALYPYRTRELMRRVKRRELEYTSSRTKARYILVARKAKDEETVKAKIDQVVTGHELGADLQPVMAALAKSAPANTQARTASHVDARMSYLLEQLQEHQKAAISARQLVEACQSLSEQA